MVGNEFDNNHKETSESILENTSSAPPKHKELLRKQAEFEMGEKQREFESVNEGKKRSLWNSFFKWLILFLVIVSLFFMARWMLF